MAGVEKVSPGVDLDIGGKTRKLVFTMRAFMLLEKATGKNALNGEIFGDPSCTDLVTLTWAALQHDPEKPSIDTVADWLEFSDFPKLSAAIQKAFEQATPEKKAEAETPQE